jgi:hypothetical protein
MAKVEPFIMQIKYGCVSCFRWDVCDAIGETKAKNETRDYEELKTHPESDEETNDAEERV